MRVKLKWDTIAPALGLRAGEDGSDYSAMGLARRTKPELNKRSIPMFLSSWFERKPARPQRNRPRLRCEQLGDRTVPATYKAATVSDLIADINAANLAG